jgi:hypothetical protein
MSTPTVSKNPLFGRAYELIVTPSPAATGTPQPITISSSAWEPEALRITFEVYLPAFKSLWFAKISIYNPTPELASILVVPGATVVLKAGYQNPGSGIIFQGTCYQPLFERENVVDQRITMMCYVGLKEALGNFASFSGSPGMSQVAIVQQAIASANTPMKLGSIDTTAISPTKLPRARAFFGDPKALIDSVAYGNNMQSWYGFDGVNIGTMERNDSNADITYSSNNGIIQTPQQTENGVNFRVLPDPRLRVSNPPMQVRIDNTAIARLATDPRNSFNPILDPNGLYIVMGLLFYGDSRGNDWFTEIVGVTSIGGRMAMIANGADPQLDRRSQQFSKFQ